jgi:hypothetical protein
MADKLFGYITFEQFVRELLLAVAILILVSLLKKLGVLSWQWSLRFIRTTRRQRRHVNFVEVRRRIQNEYYLSWKEGIVHALGLGMLMLCFLMLVVLLLGTLEPQDPFSLLVLALLVVLGGGLSGS